MILLTFIASVIGAAIAQGTGDDRPSSVLNTEAFRKMSAPAYRLMSKILSQNEEASVQKLLSSSPAELLNQIWSCPEAVELFRRHSIMSYEEFAPQYNEGSDRKKAFLRDRYLEMERGYLQKINKDKKAARPNPEARLGPRVYRESSLAPLRSRPVTKIKGSKSLDQAESQEEFDEILSRISESRFGHNEAR